MNAFLTDVRDTDVRDTVAPARGSKDGLLPPLLVGLTAVTGLVFPLVIALLILVMVAFTTVARSRSRGGVLYASRCSHL